MSQSQAILAKLKQSGHRQTVTRTALIEILATNHGLHDVAEMLTVLEKRGLRVNKTTLYRELSFLQEQGIVTDVRLNERQVRYELAGEHHHHLVCTSCEEIQEVHLENDLHEQERAIEQGTKFKIQRHVLEFFGLCQACQ